MRRSASIFLSLALLLCTTVVAQADDWTLRVATWNLLNLGDRKAGIAPVADKGLLLAKYADVFSQNDIIFLQEVLNGGQSITTAVAQEAALANYTCQTISAASGRLGRQERYSICYTNIHRADGGTLVLNGTVDYMTQGGPYIAADGTQQTAQNVWMRPPLYASFTYTPAPGHGSPYSFSVYSSHTKPSYGAGARPAGTPAGTAANASVYNELRSLEQNLRPGIANFAVLGDLNADCTSYPVARHGQNFTAAAAYTWYVDYGEKTNTALNSHCAYDRVILNTGLNQVYQAHGIYTLGIAPARLSGERVSDHYMVWLQIGKTNKRALALAATVPVPAPVSQAKRQRRFTNATAGGPAIDINAMDVSLPTGITSSAKLYIAAYSKTHPFNGNRSIPLVDVRGAPTPVTVAANGTLTSNVAWNQPVNGAYSIVIDANGDGIYRRSDGDLTSYDNQIDFIVDNGTSHSPIISLDDNGTSREIFNVNSAVNTYAVARGLVPGASVDAYVVSTKLLPSTFTTWQAEKRKGTLNLASVSIPINATKGPLLVPSLPASSKVQHLTVDPSGSIFFSAWPNPSLLYYEQAYTATPPTPVYDPNWGADPYENPCELAYQSTNTNLRAACNVGNNFSDYYGSSFNIVLDVNRTGILGTSDVVDVHDEGDLVAFFNGTGSPMLGPTSSGNPAVGEYKELLNSKLSLNPALAANNTYDNATQLASVQYLCTGNVTKSQYQTILQPAGQVGFLMLGQEAYSQSRTFSTGAYTFTDATIGNATVPANANVCITSESLSLGDLSLGAGASSIVQVNGPVMLDGQVSGGSGAFACIVALDSATIAAGGVLAAPETGGIGLLVAGVAALISSVSSKYCKL